MKSKTQSAAEKLSSESFNEKVERNIARALELKSKIEPLKDELEAIKIFFRDEVFGAGKSENRLITGAGAAILKTTNSYNIEPSNIPRLKKIFGEIYGDMVTEKTTYGVSAAFKKKLLDADYRYSNIIRRAVTITTRNSVEFEEVAINGMKHIKGGKK